jgi:hypothetical protein
LDREAQTEPAPAADTVRFAAAREGGNTQPAPDSDTYPKPYSALQKSAALRPPSVAGSLVALAGRSTAPSLDLVLHRMKDCFTEGDYQGALEAAGQVLMVRPSHATASSYSRSCQRLLAQRHAERIGDLTAVPVIAMTPDQIRWMALDHREGFLLSLIDGQTSIEEIIDIAGMDRADLLKAIANLIEQEVLRLR